MTLTDERPSTPIEGADPSCLCNAIHLPRKVLEDTGWGHCLCRCHGPGEHLTDEACPCNSTKGKRW